MRSLVPSALLALLSLASLPAHEVGAGDLQAGVGVYYDAVGADRSGPIAPGQHVYLTVRLESLALPFGDGITGVQFGLDLDPRLILHSTVPTADAFFPAEVAPNEWLLGLSQCKVAPISQYVLMFLEVSIAPGTSDIGDLRVGVRDLNQFGERMGFTRCANIAHFSRFYDAGDVLLNPSSPSIIHLSASPDVAVLGRTVTLGWDGIGDASLDGESVSAQGNRSYAASSTTTHTLELSAEASIEQEQTTVEVITIPRVESFHAVLVESEPIPKVQLNWEVSGANTVSLPLLPGIEHEIGRGILTVPDPPILQLSASNEHGTMNASLDLNDQASSLPPLILQLTATPSLIAPPATVTVSWSIFNAESAELSPGPGPIDPGGGSLQIELDGAADIVLTAHNSNGQVSRSVHVSVAPVRILSFTATPSTVYGGFPTQLEWSVENAVSASIAPEPGVIDPQGGTVEVTPTADGTTYTLTASNSEYTRTATQTVRWLPPVARIVDAPRVVTPNTEFSLGIEVEGGLSAALLPSPGPIQPQSQTVQLSIAETTLFELRVANAAAEIVAQQEVQVGPPWIEMGLIATGGQPLVGEPFTLRVHIEAAEQASLEPGVGPIPLGGGDFEFTLDAAATFVCTASNSLGTATESLLIEPILFSAALTALPPDPYGGFPYNLQATIVGAQSASLSPIGAIPSTGGTFLVNSAVPITHTLVAQRPGYTLTRTVTIDPKRPDILRFEVVDPPVSVGQPFQLLIEIAGATHATLTPNGSAISPSGGLFTYTITEATSFRLSATNIRGKTEQTLLVEPVGLFVELTASTSTPFGGAPFTLTATLVDAVSATLEPGFGAIDPAGGSFQASVATPTTFTLTASDGEFEVSDSVTVEPRAPIVSLGVPNATPFPDETIPLVVTIEGAASATLNPGFGEIPPQNATYSAQVETTTVFVLSATNPTGTTQLTRTVTPKPPRFSVAPAATPTAILAGENSTLSWTADHFDELTIGPVGFSSTQWGQGSLVVSPNATTTYEFVATNTAGITTKQVTINVQDFRIERFVATDTHISSGEAVRLDWTVLGFADVELVGIGPQPMVGSLIVTPTQTTSYVLRASHAGVTDERSLTIVVGPGNGPIIGIYADPEGSTSTIVPVLFQVYPLWIVARNIDHGISGYEVSLLSPPCDIASAVSFFPETSVVIGGPGNYIVGMGSCLFEEQLTLIYLQVIRVAVCGPSEFQVAGTSPSSFNGAPGYASCTGELIRFELGPPLTTETPFPLALELQVDALEDGNRLQWSIHATDTSSLRIYRRVDGSSEQLLRTLSPDESEWLDQDIGSGRRFEYELAALIDGEELRSARKAVERELPQLAVRSRLLPNVPNPFNPSTQLRFFLARAGSANLTIHDLSGRRVWSQSTGSLPAGEHSLTWTGIDDAGRAVASGVYLVRLQGADGDDTQRIALLK